MSYTYTYECPECGVDFQQTYPLKLTDPCEKKVCKGCMTSPDSVSNTGGVYGGVKDLGGLTGDKRCGNCKHFTDEGDEDVDTNQWWKFCALGKSYADKAPEFSGKESVPLVYQDDLCKQWQENKDE